MATAAYCGRMERTTRPIRRGTTVAALLLLIGIVGAWKPADSYSPSSLQPWVAAGPSPDHVQAASTAASVPRTASGVPRFRHVYLIVMENREYGAIVGNTKAPYINSLIAGYGLATNYHAITHPSQPNYFALFAGRTFGIRDNRNHNITARNLTNQLRDKGRTWRVYAQNVPDGCYTGKAASGGVDLVGLPRPQARAGDQLHQHLALSASVRPDHPARELRPDGRGLRADHPEHVQRHARRDDRPGRCLPRGFCAADLRGSCVRR